MTNKLSGATESKICNLSLGSREMSQIFICALSTLTFHLWVTRANNLNAKLEQKHNQLQRMTARWWFFPFTPLLSSYLQFKAMALEVYVSFTHRIKIIVYWVTEKIDKRFDFIVIHKKRMTKTWQLKELLPISTFPGVRISTILTQ